MSHLIITVLTIALMAAAATVTVNYLPTWPAAASTAERQLREALPRIEQAYDVLTRAAEGVPPDTDMGADGGFSRVFQPVLQFMPAAPRGYSWRYGQHVDDGSMYSNMHFVCLAANGGTTEGPGRGLYRAVATFSPDQAVINTGCGATSSVAPPAKWGTEPRSVTFYLAYTPGITR